MDCVLTSSKVDLVLPHSLEYLYQGYDGLNLAILLIEYAKQECLGITFDHIHGVICSLYILYYNFRNKTVMKAVQVGLYNIFQQKQMMLNTLSDRVYSVRSTNVACCCEFNMLDLELFCIQ